MAKSSNSPEQEHHVVGVRFRVTGGGNLQLRLSDLNQVQNQNLVPLAMLSSNRFEPTRLSNFQSQRIRLEGHVDTIDEYFRISRIIIFAKAVAMEYPG